MFLMEEQWLDGVLDCVGFVYTMEGLWRLRFMEESVVGLKMGV